MDRAIADRFHHRLYRLEETIRRSRTAPTIPKYDISIAPSFPESYTPSQFTIQCLSDIGNGLEISTAVGALSSDGTYNVNNDLFYNNLFSLPQQRGSIGPANLTYINDGTWHSIHVECNNVGGNTWNASFSIDGIVASGDTGITYWTTFHHIGQIIFNNISYYIDNLSINLDGTIFSHDFDDAGFGPFTQGDWTAVTIAGHKCVFGSQTGFTPMGITAGGFGTGASSVVIDFDGLFPPGF